LSGFRLGNGVYLCATSAAGKLAVYGLKPEQPKFTQSISVSVANPVFAFQGDTSKVVVWLTDTTGHLVEYSFASSLTAELTNTITPGAGVRKNEVIAVSSGYLILSSDSTGFVLFSSEGKKLFAKNFTDTVVSAPFFTYDKAKTPMIGYTERISNTINWLDVRGKLYPHFPLEGITPFETGDLLSNNANYTVCGDTKNNIRVYRLK
jgi:hypothetical protein